MSEPLKSLPTVDVILLSWNRTEMTIETIESLLEQKGVDLKIWIVDQGSTPDNLAMLKAATQAYPNICIEALEENVGVPGGRNIGMALGSSEYTVSIDNDAIFESDDALARVVQIFDQEPDLGVIGFRIMNYYTQQDDEYSWSYPKPLKQIRDQRFLTTCFCGCGHAIRRSVFEKANRYDAELFFYWEETDFSYRVINLGYKIVYEPSIRVRHKVSPEARVSWEGQRFYYLVRNVIYMRLKYAKNKLKILILILGYLVKGSYNRLLQQTLQGIIDGLKMYFRLRPQLLKQSPELYSLTSKTEDYLYENWFRHRGSLWHQIRNDVLANLPGDSRVGDLSKSKV